MNMMKNNDEMVKDLKSFEVDTTLLDMVSTYFLNQNISNLFCTRLRAKPGRVSPIHKASQHSSTQADSVSPYVDVVSPIDRR